MSEIYSRTVSAQEGRFSPGSGSTSKLDLTKAVDPGRCRWFNYRVQGAKDTELQMDIVNAGDTQAALAVGGRRGCGMNAQ